MTFQIRLQTASIIDLSRSLFRCFSLSMVDFLEWSSLQLFYGLLPAVGFDVRISSSGSGAVLHCDIILRQSSFTTVDHNFWIITLL